MSNENKEYYFPKNDILFLNLLISNKYIKLNYFIFSLLMIQEISQIAYLFIYLDQMGVNTILFTIYLILMYLNVLLKINLLVKRKSFHKKIKQIHKICDEQLVSKFEQFSPYKIHQILITENQRQKN